MNLIHQENNRILRITGTSTKESVQEVHAVIGQLFPNITFKWSKDGITANCDDCPYSSCHTDPSASSLVNVHLGPVNHHGSYFDTLLNCSHNSCTSQRMVFGEHIHNILPHEIRDEAIDSFKQIDRLPFTRRRYGMTHQKMITDKMIFTDRYRKSQLQIDRIPPWSFGGWIHKSPIAISVDPASQQIQLLEHAFPIADDGRLIWIGKKEDSVNIHNHRKRIQNILEKICPGLSSEECPQFAEYMQQARRLCNDSFRTREQWKNDIRSGNENLLERPLISSHLFEPETVSRCNETAVWPSRFFICEFDDISFNRQSQVIKWLSQYHGLELIAVIWSGAKSLHAWFLHPGTAEFKAMDIAELCTGFGADKGGFKLSEKRNSITPKRFVGVNRILSEEEFTKVKTLNPNTDIGFWNDAQYFNKSTPGIIASRQQILWLGTKLVY